MVAQSKSPDRANFQHFVGDIAWFGLALAATSRFLSVYAIRLGASSVDIGWLTSLPALVLLVSSSLGTWWARRYRDPARSLFWPGLGMRFLFLLPAFAPLLPLRWQPLWLILSITIPAIPQGPASVSFLVMMRGAIDLSQMTHLLSRRQLAMNITIAIAALIFGAWLESAPFPMNYQVMFLAAFAFSLISLYHCVSVRVPEVHQAPVVAPKSSVSPWRTRSFQKVAFVTAVIHIAFFTLVPVTPLYLVNRMGADEGYMALFALIELTSGAVASVVAPHIAARVGNRTMIAGAIAGTAISSLVIACAPSLTVALFAAIFSGGCWTAGAGVGLFSFFVENTPTEEVAGFSTAYNQMIGLAVFVGPMIGSLLATSDEALIPVILLGTALRLIAGLLVDGSQFFRHNRAASRALVLLRRI